MIRSASLCDQASFPCLLTVVLGLCCAGCGNRQPASIEATLVRAAALNDRGQFNQALTILNEAVEREPGSADAHYLRGVAYENLSQLQRAADAYSECLKYDVGRSDAYNNRGVVLGRMGDFQAAIEDLRRAVETNPGDALAWSNLGLAYHEIGDLDAAIQTYSQAATLANNPQIFYQRGNSHLVAGRYSEAIADFSRAIAGDETLARAYLNRATAYYRSGDLEAAQRDLDQAESHDRDMTITPLAANLRDSLDKRSADEKAVDAVRGWIERAGWETRADARFGFSFAAKRLPNPAPSVDTEAFDSTALPEDFYGIVLVQEVGVGIVGSVDLVRSALEITADASNDKSPLCLFVVDGSELRTQNLDRVTGQPFWLLHANYDWQPRKEDFRPFQVLFELPASTVEKQAAR